MESKHNFFTDSACSTSSQKNYYLYFSFKTTVKFTEQVSRTEKTFKQFRV